ncbi:MAG: porin [Gammaproteobacteria bacterium]|nr:porin [Gammaproteobacteria bacterium]
MALAAAPFAAQAETWNIYGWQNHSWEFVDEDHSGRSYDRIQSNAGNIGFAASMDAGNGISVNVQCEQFTYYNHFAGGTGWCNRNSKIGLSHPQMGEIMFATWLLPYNEGVAQWVDPFYDAGADSHTSIMGSVGANTIFYNTGDFDFQASASGPGTGLSGAEFNYAVAGYDTGFNRRQENIIQYWSPNWNGFVFRFAWTAGIRDETAAPAGTGDIDPVIRSSSLAYTNGPFWGAVTWQDHEDWTAASVGEMNSSDAESFRVAGRYIHDLGDGVSIQISAMWEDLEYEFNNVTSVDAAMAAFGYSNFGSSYSLLNNAGNAIGATAAMQNPVDDDDIKAQKTLALVRDLFFTKASDSNAYTADSNLAGTWTDVAALFENADTAVMDNPLTGVDESEGGCAATDACTDLTQNVVDNTALMAAVMSLDAARGTKNDDGTLDEPADASESNARAQYDLLVSRARAAAEEAAGSTPAASAAANRAAMTAGQNVKIERDAWMVSGKIKFGGPIDFRFSYMDADDLEVSCASCSGDWDETAADAWNVGVFYTMPGGTELRLTYSEVDNDDNGTYGQGISGTGLGSPGAEIEMFAVGIVHWFD